MRRQIGQVGADREVLVGPLELGHDPLAGGLIEVDHGHARSRLRERDRDLAADPAGRAGDERALALETEIDHPAPGIPVITGSSPAPCAFEPNVSGRLRPTRS